MTVIPASKWLGADGFDRKALFKALEGEYGKPVPYRTFFTWCNKLNIDSAQGVFSAQETLLLLVYCWARKRGNRNLTRESTELLFEGYQNAKA
jgi:hypothetical protein